MRKLVVVNFKSLKLSRFSDSQCCSKTWETYRAMKDPASDSYQHGGLWNNEKSKVLPFFQVVVLERIRLGVFSLK